MTVLEEVLMRLETDYLGHPYYVSGNAVFNALAQRVPDEQLRALHVSHGVFLPGEWGRVPARHPSAEAGLGKAATGLREVECYADLFTYRDAAQRWLRDDHPRDAENVLPVRSHSGRFGVASTTYFGRPREHRAHARAVDVLVHCFLHVEEGDESVLPVGAEGLDGVRVGAARNYGFGKVSVVDSQLVDLDDVSFEAIREADEYVVELVTPYVTRTEHPGAADQPVPWWWEPVEWLPGGVPGGGTDGLRRRAERLVRGDDVYAVEAIDHGQVVRYAGDDPVETARNGVTRVGTHAKFGYGEFRVVPAGGDRVPARWEALAEMRAGAGEMSMAGEVMVDE